MPLLAGCSDFRQAIGMDRVGPDEFAVESRAPLTIPPDYDLRPPQAGAARPQEVSAAEKARKAIDTAGPGEPGKQANAGLRVPAGGLNSGGSPDSAQQGEQSLLAAEPMPAGADSSMPPFSHSPCRPARASPMSPARQPRRRLPPRPSPRR